MAHFQDQSNYKGPGRDISQKSEKGGHFQDKSDYKEWGGLGESAPSTKNPEKPKTK